MSVIFMVSPDYLEVLYKEASKYKFGLQGYGSFKLACSGVHKTNPLDIIGYAFILENFPELQSSEGKSMLKLLRMINDFETPKDVVFAVVNGQPRLNDLAKKFTRVKFSYVLEANPLTDTIINRDVFGSLLLSAYKPYVFQDETSFKLGDFGSPILRYTPLFNQYSLQCLSDAACLDSVEHTLEEDVPFREYTLSNDEIMQLLRKAKVFKEFGLVFREREVLDGLIENVQDVQRWSLYRALEFMIIGGDLYGSKI